MQAQETIDGRIESRKQTATGTQWDEQHLWMEKKC